MSSCIIKSPCPPVSVKCGDMSKCSDCCDNDCCAEMDDDHTPVCKNNTCYCSKDSEFQRPCPALARENPYLDASNQNKSVYYQYCSEGKCRCQYWVGKWDISNDVWNETVCNPGQICIDTGTTGDWPCRCAERACTEHESCSSDGKCVCGFGPDGNPKQCGEGTSCDEDHNCRCGGVKCEASDGKICSNGTCYCGAVGITCSDGQQCIEGTCGVPCGDSVCYGNETCTDGVCTCDGVECKAGETCSSGNCMCGSDQCTENEDCINAECREKCGTKNCTVLETCVNDECLCGDSVCETGYACTELNGTPQCTCGGKLCGDGQSCINNECTLECGGITCQEGFSCNELNQCVCGDALTCNIGETCNPQTRQCECGDTGSPCAAGTTCKNGTCSASGSGGDPGSDSGGMPYWGWILIAVGCTLVVIFLFWLYTRYMRKSTPTPVINARPQNVV